MKNNITELVFILDRSGSMAGLEHDTIGGFNAMIEQQKKLEGKVYVTTVLFSTTQTRIHDRVEIGSVEPMTERDYWVGGGTALMDALGDAIRHIGNIHRYARPEDVPEHTIFVITTDGMENSSTRYSADQVRKLLSKQEKEHGWEFLFLAANIDAVETAAHYGISHDRAANYCPTSDGTNVMYSCVSEAVCEIRSNRPLAKGWSARMQRGKKHEA